MELTKQNSNLILAPIAGFSDCGLRTLATKFGAGLCFTEMVSALALYYKSKQTEELLTINNREINTGVQLFGNNEEVFSEIVKYKILDKFNIIDINCGCPVPKVYKNGDGSALMKNPMQIFKIVNAIKKATPERIVTIKIRKGVNGLDNYIECGKAAEDAGASMVTIHGRTREQMYSGTADLDAIAKLKQSLNIPVCGNGDVVDIDSYKRMKETGVDYVMIARGALGHPQIFAELQNKKIDMTMLEIILEHININSYMPERLLLNQMKGHISHYVKGIRNSKSIKEQIFKANSVNELTQLLINDIH